jgi:dUTP pyrophosphatase
MSVLSKADIQKLLRAPRPLIEGWIDLGEQLQPNGFDISVRDIACMESRGTIAAANAGRSVSQTRTLLFDENGFIDLSPGVYLITYNEVVHLPTNVMALARPRSSLVRCGVDVGTAVWDAGYSGRSQSSLMVHNPLGFRLQMNARVAQLVFFTLTGETEGYRGAYQGENI